MMKKSCRLTNDVIKSRLPKYLDIDLETYTNSHTKALFYDKEYCVWFWAAPSHVFNGQGNCPERTKHKTLNAQRKYIRENGNYKLPKGVSLKSGQDLPYNKQTEKRVFVDERFGDFDSTFLQLQQRGHSLHPKAILERLQEIYANPEAKKRKRDSYKRAKERNGGIHPSVSVKARLKKRATCIKKYGTPCPSQNPQVIQKFKDTLKLKATKEGLSVKEYSRKLLIERSKNIYGVDNISQVPKVRLKAAKSARKIVEIPYWEDMNEMIPCYGSWEVAVAQFLNKNKIRYQKEKIVINLKSIGKTYTPDFYLPDQDLFIEIKGRIYDTWKEKWNEFLKLGYKAELWDKNKLKHLGIKVR